ncbi:hypothetical protein LJR267_009352 [Paraburkholderia hospita]|uniref:hypothetical protein n=1 Tax=Paraburkholderia hospita TaxID=169430 RepID=UPI003ECD1A0E
MIFEMRSVLKKIEETLNSGRSQMDEFSDLLVAVEAIRHQRQFITFSVKRQTVTCSIEWELICFYVETTLAKSTRAPEKCGERRGS